MEVTVQPADLASSDELKHFLVAAWRSDVVVAHEERIRPMELPGFVALDDGRIVGHLSYRVAGSACEVTSIVADPRGRGIGSRLMEALERVAIDAGCERVWLTTTNDNLDALRFYQRRGFRLRALRPGAVERARATLKPEIPKIGANGIEMRDEIDLDLGPALDGPARRSER
jgi:ribosomal protein S18 acetylase RimI-like enzyme